MVSRGASRDNMEMSRLEEMARYREEHQATYSRENPEEEARRKSFGTYILICAAFLAVQFGHGSNIGVAVSLPGDSKAMNLALGSWVMVGVCVGLPVTPWVMRTFGAFRVVVCCVVIDFAVILLMLWPNIGLHQIYMVRFLVGFFEAPLLPYLQEWLAHFGKEHWNVWNTVLHAMVPLGENLGYIAAQELAAEGYSWQLAFFGQAVILGASLIVLVVYGRGFRYLDISRYQTGAEGKEGSYGTSDGGMESVTRGGSKGAPCDTPGSRSTASGDSSPIRPSSRDNEMYGMEMEGDGTSEENSVETAPLLQEDTISCNGVEYPVTERWAVFWATNAGLAAQLGFLSGCKYVIVDYAVSHGFSLHVTIFAFSAIALCGPALGGGIAMSGSVIRPDQWGQHKRTLLFLATVSSVAAVLAICTLLVPDVFFWPVLFAAFISAGGVYPAAQGIINIALTETRVIDASVYQVQCNNLLFQMPMPYAIGKVIDLFGMDFAYHVVVVIQVLTAVGFFAALAIASCDERSAWGRISNSIRMPEPNSP